MIGVPCPWQLFPSAPTSRKDATRLGSFEWALACIETCISTHGCGSTGENELPTRVIDISDPGSIRLVETNLSMGKYVCLSHCWGGYQPLRTTQETLQSHLKAIPWAGFPKTYQDAIVFTRFLGVKYLWIDSLCIIQDDLDDWARESASIPKSNSQKATSSSSTSP
jgi:hypothetical protein